MTTAHTPVTLDSSGTRLHTQTAELRSGAPATLVDLPGDLVAWSVTRGDVIKRLVTDSRVSRNPRKHWPGFTDAGQPGWLVPWTPASMFNADGGDHVRLRKLISRAFTPRRIKALRPAITEIVTTLLTALEARPKGEIIDLRAAFTYRIPITVICDLFGVPQGERARMQRVMDGAVNTPASADEAAANSADMIAAMRDLIDHKRRHPGPDMTSRLLEIHEGDGDRLSEDELVATLILMVGAGSETTVSLLDHAIVALLDNPDQLSRVRRDPRLWSDVIEEALRIDSPVMHIPMRYATDDIDLDGVTIRRGDLILVGFGAHGRDPGTHPHHDVFRLDREDKDHLAFGFGTHYCMGAPLARLEAAVALPALFDRFPHLTPAARSGELPRVPSFISNDYSAVPVYLHPPR
jgi:cytochrome P450